VGVVSTTKRGNELAHLLNPYIGTTEQIRRICALIARHATTHARLATAACNRELTRWEAAKETRIEARIRSLAELLPHTDNGPITVRFQEDPRGFTVKLHVPGYPQDGNTWGLDGDFGV
jgi:hypothetical protein